MNQHMRPEPVPFYDLGSQRRRLGTSIDEAISRVTSHCLFINGPEVAVLEKALADFCGARHVVSCASGTDALLMVLMAREVGPGDAVDRKSTRLNSSHSQISYAVFCLKK